MRASGFSNCDFWRVGNVQQSTTSNQPPIPRGRGAPFALCRSCNGKESRAPDTSVPHGAPAPCVSNSRRFPATRRRGSMPRRTEGFGARHRPRHDHTVLADGCWLLAVGHFRRKKDSRSVRRGNLFDASVFRLSLLIERRKCYNSNIVLLLTGCSVGMGTGKD